MEMSGANEASGTTEPGRYKLRSGATSEARGSSGASGTLQVPPLLAVNPFSNR